MTTAYIDAKGVARIQFKNGCGERKTISLAGSDEATLTTIRGHIDSILECGVLGIEPPNATRAWLAQVLPTPLGNKLAAVGLVAPRDLPQVQGEVSDKSPKLGAYIDEFIAKRIAMKTNTVNIYSTTRKHLLDHFGPLRSMASITSGDAIDWCRKIRANMAEATCRKLAGTARLFYADAVRHELLTKNPFLDKAIKTTAGGNAARFHYITPEDAQKLIDAAPDHDWRCIIALARYAGFRCPSEVLALKWEHINWEHGRVLVSQVKLEHIEGKETRLCPLFPRLREILETAFDAAPEGTEFVVNRYEAVNQFRIVYCRKLWLVSFVETAW